jgi:hypothetical protein
MSQFPSRKYMRNPGFAHCAQAVRARHDAKDSSSTAIDRPFGPLGLEIFFFLLSSYSTSRFSMASLAGRFLLRPTSLAVYPKCSAASGHELWHPLAIRRNVSRMLICALAWDIQQGPVHDRERPPLQQGSNCNLDIQLQ